MTLSDLTFPSPAAANQGSGTSQTENEVRVTWNLPFSPDQLTSCDPALTRELLASLQELCHDPSPPQGQGVCMSE